MGIWTSQTALAGPRKLTNHFDIASEAHQIHCWKVTSGEIEPQPCLKSPSIHEGTFWINLRLSRRLRTEWPSDSGLQRFRHPALGPFTVWSTSQQSDTVFQQSQPTTKNASVKSRLRSFRPCSKRSTLAHNLQRKYATAREHLGNLNLMTSVRHWKT